MTSNAVEVLLVLHNLGQAENSVFPIMYEEHLSDFSARSITFFSFVKQPLCLMTA